MRAQNLHRAMEFLIRTTVSNIFLMAQSVGSDIPKTGTAMLLKR